MKVLLQLIMALAKESKTKGKRLLAVLVVLLSLVYGTIAHFDDDATTNIEDLMPALEMIVDLEADADLDQSLLEVKE